MWIRACGAAVAAAAVLLGNWGSHPATAARRVQPALFAPSSAFESAWTPDTSTFRNHRSHCVTGGMLPAAKSDICNYATRGIYASVIYDHRRAIEIAMTVYDPSTRMGNKNPAAKRYWTFMTSVLPGGSKLFKCGNVNPSDQGGPAHACLYHYGTGKAQKSLIVAQYLNPNQDGNSGTVEVDSLHMGLNAVHA